MTVCHRHMAHALSRGECSHQHCSVPDRCPPVPWPIQAASTLPRTLVGCPRGLRNHRSMCAQGDSPWSHGMCIVSVISGTAAPQAMGRKRVYQGSTSPCGNSNQCTRHTLHAMQQRPRSAASRDTMLCRQAAEGTCPVTTHHGDMTDVLVHHESHGLQHAAVGRHRHQLALGGHDLCHVQSGRALAHHNHLGQVICTRVWAVCALGGRLTCD